MGMFRSDICRLSLNRSENVGRLVRDTEGGEGGQGMQ